MYCPECGSRIDDESALFCPECGTKVRDEASEVFNDSDDVCAAGKDSFITKGDDAYGLILTNLSLLAAKLRVAKEDVKQLIQSYIDVKRKFGVVWQLIDVDSYTYHKRGLLGVRRTVQLKATDKPWEYMDILMDVHRHELKKGLPESQYLFIIGGDDIIPMPCVCHYFPKADSDKTIDTDLLYAYPYGEEMLEALENRQIFRYEQLFMVGRLPLAKEPSLNDLRNYLQNSVDNSEGISVSAAYGQCDPHWKNVSARVANDLILCELMPDLEDKLIPECHYRRLILSPMVTDKTVGQVLNPTASLYYFNLHGSDHLQSRGYFGELPVHKGAYQVICPEHLAMLKYPNIVMTEACYGARFINLNKEHSMLLSAMSAQTLAFLGSSRIAWGGVDPAQGTTPEKVHIGLADVMATYFMKALLQGYTVGQALFAARCSVFKARPDDLKTALTLVEFNLFGDPTLALAVPGNQKNVVENLLKKNLVATEEQLVCHVEVLKSKASTNSSILNQVRSSVDANIAQMHQLIAEHLYSNYGIESRPVDMVLALRYADGHEELQHHYCAGDNQVSIQYIVTTTKQGEIKDVYASR